MSETSRRSFLRAGAGAVLAFPMISLGSHAVFAASAKKYSTRAIDLVKRSLVIDMLAPLTLDFSPERFAETLSPEKVAMYRSSGITGFHNAMGIGGADAHQGVLRFMAAWSGFAARNSELFLLVNKADDLARAKAQGKIALIQGVQNAEHFRTPEDVKLFYQLGQRCSQLTYNSQTRVASGSTERVDGGVTDFGVSIIKAMNDVGMLVDVSHCGDRTTLDAIDISPKPIAFTHSNCRALNPGHPRVKTDEAIKKLAAKGGVIGITGVRNFLSPKEPTTVENVVDHIDHVVRLVGLEHVGIGSDADLNGYDDMPAEQYARLRASYKDSYAFRAKIDTDGFDHPQKIYDLTESLIRRGYTDAQIEAVLGGNFKRLLQQTWG